MNKELFVFVIKETVLSTVLTVFIITLQTTEIKFCCQEEGFYLLICGISTTFFKKIKFVIFLIRQYTQN